MSILDDLKRAKGVKNDASATVATNQDAKSDTPLLDNAIKDIAETIACRAFDPLANEVGQRVLISRIRQARDEYLRIVEGDEIDKREAEAIAEGKQYLAKLPAGIRANIEAQLGRKLG